MPKTPINYEKTIIYQIVCKDITISDKYVGHTTNFTNRKRAHKNNCNNIKNNIYVYTIIRQNGGWENWDMIMIEEISVANVNEAKKIERHWIETLQASLNKRMPGRTDIEYYKNNKDALKEKQKIYDQNNKDIIKERKKIYRENNKDIINKNQKIYDQNNKNRIKERHKIYRENNKDRINEQKKIYYENNKDKIKERKKIYRNLQKENTNDQEPSDQEVIP